MALTVFCDNHAPDEDQPEMVGTSTVDKDFVVWNLRCPECKTKILISLDRSEMVDLVNHN